MVEDWLNPELGEADDQAAGSAPQVQDMDSQAADPASAAQQLKFSKTDESYHRSGPGSPGYTRHGQRSPGTGDGTPAGPPRAAKGNRRRVASLQRDPLLAVAKRHDARDQRWQAP